MSFEFDDDPKSQAAVDYMTMLQRELVRAAVEAKKETGMTQKRLADLLGVDKASISRILRGHANPTARTVGELLWALGVEPKFTTSRSRPGNEIMPAQTAPIIFNLGNSAPPEAANTQGFRVNRYVAQ